MIDNRFSHAIIVFCMCLSIGRDILVCPLIFRRPNHLVDTFLLFFFLQNMGFTMILRVEITIPLVRIVLVVNIV